MNKEEFIEKFILKKVPLMRIEGVSNIDISNLQIPRIHIFEVDMSKSKFKNCNLISAKFRYVDLIDTDFSNANLQNASFMDGKWGNANFRGANLSGAFLCDMESTVCPDFSHTNCEDINISYCHLFGTSFEKANLKGARFSRGRGISKSNLSDACLIGIKGEAGLFGGSIFDRADVRNADFNKATLTGASFRDANLAYADLTDADFSNTDLTNANFSYAILIGIKLEGAILDNTNFTGSITKKAAKIDRQSLGIQYLQGRILPDPIDRLFSDVKNSVDKFYLGSDRDYPCDYTTYLVKHEFSLENLFKYEQYLEPVSYEYFWRSIPDLEPLNFKQQFAYGCQSLLSQVSDYIERFEIYRLQTNRLKNSDADTLVYLILALTKTGDWLGLSVESDSGGKISDFHSDPSFLVRDFASSKPENTELVLALEESIDNTSILRPKATTYSHSPLDNNGEISKAIWTLNEDRESAFVNLLILNEHVAVVKYLSVAEIVEPEPEDEDDNRYQIDDYKGQIFNFDPATSRLIAKNFTNLRYYYVGDVEIDMYLVGQSPHTGDGLILHTSVIWA